MTPGKDWLQLDSKATCFPTPLPSSLCPPHSSSPDVLGQWDFFRVCFFLHWLGQREGRVQDNLIPEEFPHAFPPQVR
ncbi:hypothetical protein AV530_015252 [Patagioenas fasciata monilis]|uniref:Uncharacterized protein n=1 Tax=Patagioenas fasciata monilis TaxID=372326 RepID=A0A1V4K1G6_PATFA|nr:hypothetical protein AV530_015252 [Patagioenas fasciata monilis]